MTSTLRNGFPLSLILLLAGLTACSDQPVRQENIAAETLYGYYMDNHDALAELVAVEKRLADKCLEELGVKDEHRPVVDPPPQRDGIEDYLYNPRRPTREEAESIGYRGVYQLASEQPEPVTDSLDERARTVSMALRDDPEAFRDMADDVEVVAEAGLDLDVVNEFLEDNAQGCTGWARARFIDDEATFQAYQDVTGNIGNTAHPGFVAAEDDWAGCMRERGWSEVETFDHVFVLEEAMRLGEMEFAEFDEKQRDLAMTDAVCAERLDIDDRLDRAYEGTLRDMVAGEEARFFNAATYYRNLADEARTELDS
ncbi:hypothetical protein [Salininema proteolyticum]|uniref:Lipoprotein n=1 Tax=Salininema proteolyticum TaxID=1607685 RepID=A0ABV8TVA6_9ACTN